MSYRHVSTVVDFLDRSERAHDVAMYHLSLALRAGEGEAVAGRLGVSRTTLYRWVAQWRAREAGHKVDGRTLRRVETLAATAATTSQLESEPLPNIVRGSE